MSREIKFRAWDGDRLTDDFYVNHLGKPSFWNTDSGVMVDTEWPLMQFTGLYDKNGKEVFEGDIVKEPHSDNEPRRLYTVRWNNSESCWELWSVSHAFYTHYSRHFKDVKVLEVIGNIYENPELLKGADDN